VCYVLCYSSFYCWKWLLLFEKIMHYSYNCIQNQIKYCVMDRAITFQKYWETWKYLGGNKIRKMSRNIEKVLEMLLGIGSRVRKLFLETSVVELVQCCKCCLMISLPVAEISCRKTLVLSAPLVGWWLEKLGISQCWNAGDISIGDFHRAWELIVVGLCSVNNAYFCW